MKLKSPIHFIHLEESDWASGLDFDEWSKQVSIIAKTDLQSDGYQWELIDYWGYSNPICQKDMDECKLWQF